MKKIVFLAFVSVLLLTVVLMTFVKPVVAEETIYIRADGSVDPDTAPISTTDNVTYTPTDNINASIIIERDNIVVDGGGYTLQGMGTDNGIYLSGRKNVTIKNFEINQFGTAICIDVGYDVASNNTISGNIITNNSYGIYLETSNYNVISGNNLTNNEYGIFLLGSQFNIFRNNKMVDNGQNLVVHGLDPGASTQHMDTSNTVNGKPVYYWIEEKNKTVPSDAGYVALTRCTNITVQSLNLTNNGQGILLASTTDSTITKNTIINNGEGIYLWDSSNNIISENILTNNNRGIHIFGTYPIYSPNNRIYRNLIANNDGGILIMDSSNNSIYENDIANNGYGIYIEWGGASNNSIYHNNFINNTAEVPGTWQYIGPSAHPVWMPPSSNAWDNGVEGNYWSDYVTRYPNATEIDGSGIWDTPYVISENNQDNHPLIIPEFPTGTSMILLLIALTVAVAFYKRRLPKTPIR